MEYLRLVRLLVVSPRQALVVLDEHPRRVAFGVVSLLLHSFVAMTKQLYFDATGVPVVPPPFLAIPASKGWLATWTITLVGMHGALAWWVVFVTVCLWILALIVLSVCVAQRLRLAPGFLTCLAGLLPALALTLTYVR